MKIAKSITETAAISQYARCYALKKFTNENFRLAIIQIIIKLQAVKNAIVLANSTLCPL